MPKYDVRVQVSVYPQTPSGERQYGLSQREERWYEVEQVEGVTTQDSATITMDEIDADLESVGYHARG